MKVTKPYPFGVGLSSSVTIFLSFFYAYEGIEMTGTFTPKGHVCGPIMPSSLMKKTNVSMGAKMLYAAMVSCSRPGQDCCWPSQAWLAEQIGASVRSVQNYLAELERLGFIIIDRSRLGASLHYYFLEHEDVQVWTPREKENAGYAKSAGGVRKVCVLNNYNNKLLNTPLSPRETSSQGSPDRKVQKEDGAVSALDNCEKHFFEIWNLWPRTEALYAAKKEWRKLWFSGQLPSPMELKQKIEFLQKNDRAWLRGFAPYFVTWLKDRRWNDQFSPSTQEQKVESPDQIVDLMTDNIAQYYQALLKQEPTSTSKSLKIPNPIPLGVLQTQLQRTMNNANG